MRRIWTCSLCTLNNEDYARRCAACGSSPKAVESDSGSEGIQILDSSVKIVPERVSCFKREKIHQSPWDSPSSPNLAFQKDKSKSAHAVDLCAFPSSGVLGKRLNLVDPYQKRQERKEQWTSKLSSAVCGLSSDDNGIDSMGKLFAAASRSPAADNNYARDIAAVVMPKSPRILSPKKRQKSKDKSPKEAERVRKRQKREEEKKKKAEEKELKRKKREQERLQAARKKSIQKVEKMYKAKNYMLHEIQIVFHPKVLELNGQILPTLAEKSSDWCPGASSKFHKHAFQYRVDNSIHDRMVTWEKFQFDPSFGQENPFDKTKISRNFPGPPEPITHPNDVPRSGAPRSYAVFYLNSGEVLCESIMNVVLEESLQFTDVLLLVTNYTYSGLPRKPCPIQEKLTTIWFDSENRIRYKLVKTDKEAAQFIGRHTRTLAEEQFKVKPTVISMAIAGKISGLEKGVKRTLTDSWMLYLMQIDQISEDKARRIVTAYPTFSSLWNTYSSLSVIEGEKLLADKLSNRNEVALSQKVYRWLYAPVTGNESL